MASDIAADAVAAPRADRASLAMLAKDALGYGAASAAALAVDWGSLIVLHNVFQVNYFAAAGVAFTLGLFVAYALSMRYVFKGRARYGARGELVGFAVTGALGLALNQALMFALVAGLHLPAAAAKAPTVAFVFTFNFLSRRFFLFSSARA